MRVKKKELQSPLIRQRDVIALLSSDGLFRRCAQGGWLVPVARDVKVVLYRRSDVEGVLARIMAGEMPPPLRSTLAKAEAKAKARAAFAHNTQESGE